MLGVSICATVGALVLRDFLCHCSVGLGAGRHIAGRTLDLLDLAMEGVFAELRVVLLEFKAFRGVPAVLDRRIARRARSLCAFEDNLYANVFSFCHWSCSSGRRWASDTDAVGTCFLKHGTYPFLVYGFQRLGRDSERHPAIFFRNVEALFLKVYIEPPPHLVVSVRNVVPRHGPLAGYLIFACHCRRSNAAIRGLSDLFSCSANSLKSYDPVLCRFN